MSLTESLGTPADARPSLIFFFKAACAKAIEIIYLAIKKYRVRLYNDD
jgi:hypothetical protein